MEQKIIVEDAVSGEKTLKLKTTAGLDFTLELKAPDVPRRKYIESIYYRNIDSLDELDMAHHVHASRIVRSCIKAITGLWVRDPKTKKVKEFKVEFTDSTKTEITLESYGVIINFFEQHCTQETVQQFFTEYANITGLPLPEYVKEDKKKV